MTNLELAILTYAHILPKLHNMAGTMKLTIVASLIVGPLPLHLPRAEHQPLDCAVHAQPDDEL